MTLLPNILPRSKDQRRARIYRDVLRYEAKVGGNLFGKLAPGHHREFFCLDKYTWVWHEEWLDAKGQRQVVATYYSFRPDGVLKSQNNHGYQKVGDAELQNLYRAIDLYAERVPAALHQLQTA